MLALITASQGLRKGRAEILKLKLETELKDAERTALLTRKKEESETIVFEDIGLDPNNNEWREVPISDINVEHIGEARLLIDRGKLNKLRYFEIFGPFQKIHPELSNYNQEREQQFNSD